MAAGITPPGRHFHSYLKVIRMFQILAPKPRAHLDLETFSPPYIDLSKFGAHLYAEHPKTGCFLFSYKINKNHTKLAKLWFPQRWPDGSITPPKFIYPECNDLLQHIHDGETVVSHNSAFERSGWNNILCRYFPKWPRLRIAQQDCTMARANAFGFRGKLEHVLIDIGASHQKDMGGADIMKKMMHCVQDNGHLGPITPEDYERLGSYCVKDTDGEAEVDEYFPGLNPIQRRIWELDQEVNDRGIPFDLVSVAASMDLTFTADDYSNKEMRELTDGAVGAVTQNVKLLTWLRSRGHQLEGVGDFVLETLDTRGDMLAQKVIDLRRATARSSLSKIDKIWDQSGNDSDYTDSGGWPRSRVRGQYVFMGTGPGRWSGRATQPQNFPRMDEELEGPDVAIMFKVFEDARGNYNPYRTMEMLKVLTGKNPLTVMSSGLRAFIKAEEGNVLIDTDLANIQGRVNAFLADETWKLQAFRDYDAKIGPDLYKLTYGRSFGVEVDTVKGFQRQIGKVMELASGFQGGVGAYISMGPTYKIRPSQLVAPVRAATDPEHWQKLINEYPKARDKQGLVAEEWAAIKILVFGYRATNPNITRSWKNLQKAALMAVDNPGQTIIVDDYQGIAYRYDPTPQPFLWCFLPSGRAIPYLKPVIKMVKRDCLEMNNGELVELDDFPLELIEMYIKNGWASLKTGKARKTVSYTGKIKTVGWGDKYLYGGLQCENVVMGTEVDILWEKMLMLKDAGFPIALHTHDSVTTEVRAQSAYLAELRQHEIMSSPVAWLPGLPIAAKTHAGARYAGD